MKNYMFTILTCFIAGFAFAQPKWIALPNAPNGLGRFDDIFFLNNDLGWAANGPSGVVFKTTDGGISWTQQFSVPESYFRNIEFIDENIGFIGTLDGVFYKTVDGGNNWSIQPLPKNPEAICGLDVVGTSTVYGCGAWFSPAHIIKSVDSGATWEFIDMSAYANALVEILFVDEQLGYTSGKNSSGGVVLKTTDGGATWTEIYNSGRSGDFVWKLQLRENNTHIFGSVYSNSQGQLIKSFDSGATWIEKDFFDASVQAVGFVSDTNGWMGGHGSGFYETTDGGDTWGSLNLGSNLNRIFIIQDDFAYCSGSTIYKFEDNLAVSDFDLPKEEGLNFAVAPMPIKDQLHIEIDFTHVDNLVIELYNLNGQLLEHLVRDQIPTAQKKTYVLEFKHPVGTYVLDIHTNNGRRSKTIVKE